MSELQSIYESLLQKRDLKPDLAILKEVDQKEYLAKVFSKEEVPNIKIFSQRKIYLSEIITLLNNFGIGIIDEVSFSIEEKNKIYFIIKINLDVSNIDDFNSIVSNLESVITGALRGELFDSCGLYKLIPSANLSIREIYLLKGIIEYLNQIDLSTLKRVYIDLFINHNKFAKLLVQYISKKFTPHLAEEERKNSCKDLENQLKQYIFDAKTTIDEDNLLGLILNVVTNIVRTNYYKNRDSIAFKLNVKGYVDLLKGLQPNIETFVYHPEFNGLHLRMTKVSRGGLRWSERPEDYREEIKSLMIAQEGKNSIIVPSGAKGGFVIFKERKEITMEVFTDYYSRFINNLLDLVDNQKDGQVVKDPEIIAFDGDDPYFVVAADKGTAMMSDTANNIAIERGFWLEDAFASGGSKGYSHKDLGITAKGSFVSTERFFVEKGINCRNTPVSVVGIGSMNGDVFGNGILLSPKVELIGAISHKEVFIDPYPNIEEAYEERKRLFNAKRGGWSQYNTQKISRGGGIFLRADKSVTLTPEIKERLNISESKLSGEALAQKLLTANVDLLFNGGVGTYVKSSEESNSELGDVQNKGLRINGNKLNAKVVCEGGNLGFTQRGRIEYAKNGGRINLDGIDNSAGVNISDHEVNLKILFNLMKKNETISTEKAESLFKELTDEVMTKVLQFNYDQALAISLEEIRSKKNIEQFIKTVHVLEENLVQFKRKFFGIPLKDRDFNTVLSPDDSIVRPILSFLISYSKIFIKNILLDEPEFFKEANLKWYLYRYFPDSLVKNFSSDLLKHPLKNEIIATMIADEIINNHGVNFINDFQKLGKDDFIVKIRSYLIIEQFFGAQLIREKIATYDYSVETQEQYKLLLAIEESISFSIDWMVKYFNDYRLSIKHILSYKDIVTESVKKYHYITPCIQDNLLIAKDERLYKFFGRLERLKFSVASINIEEKEEDSFENINNVLHEVISKFKVIELMENLSSVNIRLPEEAELKEQLESFIESILTDYTKKIVSFKRNNETAEEAFVNFVKDRDEKVMIVIEELDTYLANKESNIIKLAVILNKILLNQ